MSGDRERGEGSGDLEAVLAEAIRHAPREREPSDLLERRTVRALHAAGLLQGRPRAAAAWWVAGVAASVALFACGMVTGQWLGGRQAGLAVVAQQQATLEEMAALVERTGGAYVSALARLAESSESPGASSTQARERALQILHQAANEVVRLAPNDPVAARILQGFDHAALQREPANGRERRRQIVWF